MAGTPYTLTQSAVNVTVTATTSRAQAFTTQNLASGSMIWGWIWVGDSAGRITSPTVSDGTNTYTVKLIPVTSGGSFIVFWVVNQSLATTPTVTVSWTGSVVTGPLVISERAGIPSDFVFDLNVSAHKTSGTGVTLSTLATTKNNAFCFGAMWNSGANTLTDPPTVSPGGNWAIGNHGIIGTSIYADSWVQQSVPESAASTGFTVSSATEVSDLVLIAISAKESPWVQSVNAQSTAFSVSASPTISINNCLIALGVCSFTSGSPTGQWQVSDNKSGVWKKAFEVSSGSVAMAVFYCLNAPNATPAITLNNFGTAVVTGVSLTVHEFAKTNLVALDGSSSATIVSTTHMAAGSFTPAQNGDLIFYAAATVTSIGGGNAASASGLFCSSLQANTGTASMSTVDAYLLQAAAAAINGQMNFATAHTGVAGCFALTTVAAAVIAVPNSLMMMGAGT